MLNLDQRVVRLIKQTILATVTSLGLFLGEQSLAQQRPQKQGSELFPGLRNPSAVLNKRYDIESDYFVTFSEITDRSSGLKVYEISFNVKPNADPLFNHIRQAGMIMDGNRVLDDRVRMFYNTSREDVWRSIGNQSGSDHALLMKAYEKYKGYVPQVASVANGLENLQSFFDWIDSHRDNFVYPRLVNQGSRFLIPIDLIAENLNFLRFKREYVDGVRFVVGSLDRQNDFFIRFRVGQYSGVPTGSKEFGIEILADRSNPKIYTQTRGNISLAQGNEINSPSSVAKSFFEAYSRADLDTMKNLVVFDMLNELREAINQEGEKAVADALRQKRLKLLGIEKEVIGPESLTKELKIGPVMQSKRIDSSDFARVECPCFEKFERLYYVGLVRLDGKWKVYGFDNMSDDRYDARKVFKVSRFGQEYTGVACCYEKTPDLIGGYAMTVGKSQKQGYLEFEFFRSKGDSNDYKPIMSITATRSEIIDRDEQYKTSDLTKIERIYHIMINEWLKGRSIIRKEDVGL